PSPRRPPPDPPPRVEPRIARAPLSPPAVLRPPPPRWTTPPRHRPRGPRGPMRDTARARPRGGGRDARTDRRTAMPEPPHNWGRWGDGDQLGTLNLLTPERVLAALGAARTGRVLGLALPIKGATSGTAPAG